MMIEAIKFYWENMRMIIFFYIGCMIFIPIFDWLARQNSKRRRAKAERLAIQSAYEAMERAEAEKNRIYHRQ